MNMYCAWNKIPRITNEFSIDTGFFNYFISRGEVLVLRAGISVEEVAPLTFEPASRTREALMLNRATPPEHQQQNR